MGIIATDILIKTMIEAAIVDIRRNNWLLDDIFGGLVTDPLSKHEYGYAEVKNAKNWFNSNHIAVYMHNRIDNPTFPCITIVQAPSTEREDRTSFSDEGSISEIDPKSISVQPQIVYPPFSPSSYDPSTGIMSFPSGINTDYIVPGQFLVSQRSGKAYQILEYVSTKEFKIKPGIIDDFTDAYIVPPTSLWNLQREQTFLHETFAIGCHAQSDPVQAIWLRQLVIYILLRYKEAYLESRGFELSTFSAGNTDFNPHFEIEKVYSCVINLSGIVEANWIKYVAPKLQSVRGGIRIMDGPKTPPNYITQVKNQGWRMSADQDDVKVLGEEDESED